ncbi:MAG: hypothetical protein L0211_11490 [Planctomycetaceae bacterium]|nr:hypothetical protein [Planctomycetaceae bacterium]
MTARPSTARLGCGFVFLVVFVSCALLAINGMIVLNVLESVQGSLPPMLRETRWMQAYVFLGPVLMLVVQWWAYDVAVDWLWPMRHSKNQAAIQSRKG